MADTSYSNMKCDLSFAGDNRGNAVCDISFRFVEGERQCHVRGYTEKEQIIDYQVGHESGDPLVGLVQPEGCEGARFYVKAVLP